MKINSWYYDNGSGYECLFFILTSIKRNYLIYEVGFSEEHDYFSIYYVPFEEKNNIIFSAMKYKLKMKDKYDIVSILFEEGIKNIE